MRRTVLSAGVSARDSLRERKSPGDFPNPPVSLSKNGVYPPDTLSLIFPPLNFSTKKRQLNYILKNRETGDNRPIARFFYIITLIILPLRYCLKRLN